MRAPTLPVGVGLSVRAPSSRRGFEWRTGWCHPGNVLRTNWRRGGSSFAGEGVIETHLGEAGEFGFGQTHAAGVFVFVEECRVEHRGIVGGEDDWDAVAEELWKRMMLDLGVFAAQLTRQGTGTDVALRADFEGNAAVGEQVHERGVVDGGDAVADPFGPEQFDGFTDFFGAADFAGVHQAMQADLGGFVVDGAKIFCRDR